MGKFNFSDEFKREAVAQIVERGVFTPRLHDESQRDRVTRSTRARTALTFGRHRP